MTRNTNISKPQKNKYVRDFFLPLTLIFSFKGETKEQVGKELPQKVHE